VVFGQQPPRSVNLPEPAKRFGLIVGINDYEYQADRRLKFAVNDAHRPRKALIENMGFPPDNITVIVSDPNDHTKTDKATIDREISAALKRAKDEGGLLVLAISSHGLLVQGQSFLLAGDSQFTESSQVMENHAFGVGSLLKRIQDSLVPQALVFLDACRNRADMARMEDPAARGTIVRSPAQYRATLFATAEGGLSYECPRKEMGCFMAAVTEGLAGGAAAPGGYVTLGGLAAYVQRSVPDLVSRDWPGVQPTQRQVPPPPVLVGFTNELVLTHVAGMNCQERPRRRASILNQYLRDCPGGLHTPWVEHTLTELQGTLISLCGSTTLGVDAAPSLAFAFLSSIGAKNLSLTRPTPDTSIAAGNLNGSPVRINITANGTANGFADFNADKCEIAMASERLAKAAMQTPQTEHLLGADGVSIIVNPSVKVRSLTKTQLCDIFSGRIRNWADVGGDNLPILLHVRKEGSGTQQFTFQMLCGRSNDVLPNDGVQEFEDSYQLMESVAADRGAIGFVGLPYADKDRVGTLALPLPPTRMAVATGEYVLSRPLYFYTKPAPSNPYIGDFVAFSKAAGKRVMNATGFVAIAAEARVENPPGEYGQFVKGGRRLTLSIHYRVRETNPELDEVAEDDIRMLKAFLQEDPSSRYELSFAGFTDAAGSVGENLKLSSDRAESLAKQFQSPVVSVRSKGFGRNYLLLPEKPLDDRNRRVEVWIRRVE
jgi:phosphate transport system substrate-binding protein